MDRSTKYTNMERQPEQEQGRMAWVPGCIFSGKGCEGCVDERTSLCRYLRRTARISWCTILAGEGCL